MCVIAAKPAGIDMPTDKEIKNMWDRNSDGAGIMYVLDKRVVIEKGFMEFQDIRERLDQLDDLYGLKELAMVLHFRITTHGGTKPECCHPFPISDSMGVLRKLHFKTKVGVAHNGIVPGCSGGKDFSDTMEYICEQLAPLYRAVPKFYEDKNLMQLIKNATASKLAFLTSDEKIYTVGKFIEHNGVMYSNSSYEHSTSWRDFDYAGWNCYGGGWENVGSLPAYSFTAEVMWLDESKGEYVVNDKGEYVWDKDFALSAYGTLYEYDYDEDALVLSKGCRAYNSEGMSLKYDPKSDFVTRELVVW